MATSPTRSRPGLSPLLSSQGGRLQSFQKRIQPDVFVEPLLRHTLLKVLAAFLVATVLVAGFTLATAVLRRAGEGELGGYREFMEVLRDATADVRRLFGRAA